MTLTTHTSRPARRRAAGFTLLELVIVMLVLAILWAAAAPRYHATLARMRAETTARRLAADLRQARSNAKRDSASRTVQFYVADNRYVLSGATRLNRRGGAYEVDLDAPEHQTEIVSASFGGGDTVTFDFYGRPDNAGSVVIECGGAQRTVAVDANGAISIP